MARSRRQITPIAAPGAEALPLHMTFRISPELRERLAAAAGDRPIGEEIRRRLEASFAPSAAGSDDPKTGELAAAIVKAANQLRSLNAPWHADTFSHAAFKHAIGKVLDAEQPPREGKVNPEGLGARLFWKDDVTPAEVGNMVAAIVISDLRKE